ncbi:uncharacterized protein LOC134248266 [Saccostrea cucullata]|uniref:uncharacterized protein LOC134248266 n=1 Tax=Saccostrea cuccullata TaxID=36930 RepID=UPI002ED5CAFB
MILIVLFCLLGNLRVEAERLKLGDIVQENTEPLSGVSNPSCTGSGALVFRGDATSIFSAFCLSPPGRVRQCVVLVLGEFERFVCPQKGYLNGFINDGGQRGAICCSVSGVSYNDNECGEWFRTRENFASPFGPGFLITGTDPEPDGMGGNLGFFIRECPYRTTYTKKYMYQ